MKSKTIICGSNVPELCTVEMTDTEFVIGSAVTMRSLEQALNDKTKGVNGKKLTFSPYDLSYKKRRFGMIANDSSLHKRPNDTEINNYRSLYSQIIEMSSSK